MPVNLEWRVGPSGEDAGVAEPGSPTILPPRRRRMPALMALVVLYGGAIFIAAWLGFELGRWSDDRASGLADVDTQLAIETLAWRDGDASLYITTLDPDAPGWWRDELEWRFVQSTPDDRTFTVVESEPLAPDLVRVLVEFGSVEGTSLEERAYRLVGRSWFRTPPPAEARRLGQRDGSVGRSEVVVAVPAVSG